MRILAMRQLTVWLVTAGCFLPGCNHESESAAQSARLSTLEQEVRRLGDQVAGLATQKNKPATPQPGGAPSDAFKITCPQPWLRHTPLGATIWSCRAPTPSPEGLYPQCSVSHQPQLEIETKHYFEFGLNAGPQLRDIKNLKDKPIKLGAADGFEATFDADPKPVPLRLLSVLMPHGEWTFMITCSAPSPSFESYSKAFRQIIDTFAFN
jgi:hypothetical protein